MIERMPDEAKNEQKPERVDVMLGYPSAALSLGNVRYPVSMCRETMEGVVLEGPETIEDRSKLEEFCRLADERHKQERHREGYWRIRSL